jgi:Transposase DNA-binding
MDPMLERTAWLDAELAGCTFADVRLGKRLRTLLERLGGAVGASLPLACQDWAATKAAYRFFTNQRVSEKPILAGHLAATRSRLAAADSPILILHDTTEFTFQRQRSEAIGVTYSVNSGKDKAGRWRMHTVCGILMHSSLAVTVDGLPLGLAAIKVWTRKKFRGIAALKRRINLTRVPIEAKESVR